MEATQEKRILGGVREIIHLSWPIVVSMLSYTAMGFTDTMFVGWVGKIEVGAIGLAIVAIFLVNSFFLGVLNGVKVVCAQATGAEDRALARAAAWQGVWLSIPFGLVVIILGLFDESIFALMGGSQEVQSLAGEYFRVRVYSAPLWYVSMALCNALQGTGDTRTPMVVNLFANGLNIVLDPLFIFGCGPIPVMGVEGAAVATVLACAAGMVLTLVLYIRKSGFQPRIHSEALVAILKLGLPMGVRFALEVGGWTVVTAFIANMGENDLAANQITITIIRLSFLPGYAISEATCILTGKYIGARKVACVRRSFTSGLKVAIAVMGGLGLVFWLAPELLLRCFQNDPAVLLIGRDLLLIAAVFQIIDAIAMVSVGALNGVGDTRYTMYVSVGAAWFVLVPCTYLFGIVLGMGVIGAWMGVTAEILVLAAVLTVRFYREGWRDSGVVVTLSPASPTVS